MDELEKNIPDDFWRKTFDEAAETPPPRVWDSIERRLDESNSSSIIPLWRSGLASSKLVFWATGIAASLALLLVGWWAMSAQSTNQVTSRLQLPGQSGPMALHSTEPTNSSASKSPDVRQSNAFSADRLATSLSSSVAPSDQSPVLLAGKATGKLMAQAMTQPDQRGNLLRTTMPTFQISSITGADAPVPTINRLVATSLEERAITAEGLPGRTEIVMFKELRGRPLRLRSPGAIQRIVWSRPAEFPLESTRSKSKRSSKELWASVSAMPGAFNPMVSLRSAPVPAMVTTANFSVANSNQPTVSSRANFSVAYQASAGVQLNERWSVESGVGYLAGHSTVEAPVQSVVSNFAPVANTYRDAGSNVYVNALQNSASNKLANSAAQTTGYAGAAYDLVVGNSVNQSQQTLANDYQYVQVPVQVGYQLRPRKKLSLAVLGGLLTNIFIKNTVGSDVVVTAKDGVYKPVSLAATMGARFRYRPSGRWSASLAGLYQPSLGTGTDTNSQVQSRPTSTGMSLGLDYHF